MKYDELHETSTEIGELSTALAAALKTIDAPAFNATGQARGGTYRYSSLAAYHDAARKILAEHGLTVSEMATRVRTEHEDTLTIIVKLRHSSGQWEKWASEGHPLLGSFNRDLKEISEPNQQDFGKSATYGYRYCYAGIIGITGEPDDDAADVDPRPAAPRQSTPRHELTTSQRLAALGILPEHWAVLGLRPDATNSDGAALVAALAPLSRMRPSEIGADPVAALRDVLAGGAT
jgi:hypothetical protein